MTFRIVEQDLQQLVIFHWKTSSLHFWWSERRLVGVNVALKYWAWMMQTVSAWLQPKPIYPHNKPFSLATRLYNRLQRAYNWIKTGRRNFFVHLGKPTFCALLTLVEFKTVRKRSFDRMIELIDSIKANWSNHVLYEKIMLVVFLRYIHQSVPLVGEHF